MISSYELLIDQRGKREMRKDNKGRIAFTTEGFIRFIVGASVVA